MDIFCYYIGDQRVVLLDRRLSTSAASSLTSLSTLSNTDHTCIHDAITYNCTPMIVHWSNASSYEFIVGLEAGTLLLQDQRQMNKPLTINVSIYQKGVCDVLVHFLLLSLLFRGVINLLTLFSH